MSQKLRKLVGTLTMLVFVVVYALVVMALAQPILRNAGAVTQLVFYAVAGMSWILPIMPLVKWMERRDR